MKRNFFGRILIIIGVFIMFISLYLKFTGSYENQKEVEQFEESIEKEQNQETIQKKENHKKNTEHSSKVDTIGILEIPKIDLKLAVGEGIDSQTLKYAIGHFPETPMAGQTGNFSLAGHRSHTYNKFFNRLNEIDSGDIIKVTTKDGFFEYMVDSKKVVKPSQIEVLESTNEKDITLITCTYINGVSHRLVIKGRLIE